MFSSLRFRLWLTYMLVVIVVIAIAALAVVVYLYRNPTTDRQEIQRLRILSSFLLNRSQAFDLLPQDGFSSRFQQAVVRADNATGVRVAVFSNLGELIADSRADKATPLPEWSVIHQQSSSGIQVIRDSDRRQWLFLVSPTDRGFYLVLATPRLRMPILSVLKDEFLIPFGRGVALALILSIVLTFWIANWITSPLKRMSDAARSVPVGEFEPIPLRGPREVQSLAQTINEMGELVHASQRSQRDFIANVSHDLKTPITSIQGFAQAIMDGTVGDSESLRGAAQVIYDEASRMHRMVLDLLELARFDSGMANLERLPLDLGDLLSELVVKLAPQAKQANVDFQTKIGSSAGSLKGELTSLPGDRILDDVDSLPCVIGDADRLEQAFTNLVDNALKHTPAGGQVQISAESHDGWIEVKITDDGPGIPQEDLERIFERFYQVDKSRRGGEQRGVGLGLSIAREIILAHGGMITAYSPKDSDNMPDTVGYGSVFVVKLPVVLPDGEIVSRRK